MSTLEPPMGLIAEITHRCPLQCPYCSNPLELERAGTELDTATWLRVLDEAAALVGRGEDTGEIDENVRVRLKQRHR